MILHIKNLRLRTVLGVYDWERQDKQDVVINIRIEFEGEAAGHSDRIEDTLDYKALKRRIIDEVDGARYFLVEKLTSRILEIVMSEGKVQGATVEVDKPGALRFCDSVSIACSARR